MSNVVSSTPYRRTLERSDLTESSECWVDAVWSVCGCHDNDMSPLLQPIHQSEKLRDNAPLHLTMSLTKQKYIYEATPIQTSGEKTAL